MSKGEKGKPHLVQDQIGTLNCSFNSVRVGRLSVDANRRLDR